MSSVARRGKNPGKIYIGCSGWAYPSWKPDFYPATAPTKRLLEFYAARLNSVEVNYTFRSLPSEKTVEGWLAATSEDFRFSFKAPQRITHILRLKNCAKPLEEFYAAIRPVADASRLGAILFQLPPNMKADFERLAAFLSEAASEGWRLAFEFRHESWFSEETYALLREHGVALCVAESDELATPAISTAGFSCYRLRKSEYSDNDLAAIERKLRSDAVRGDVFAYFKHEEEPTGALRALHVTERLQTK
ncbi:DUF72 domain-containing protein [Silvibacterium acidisoli]|uniref:DUF72 domain-containing protein n=1 Tax=Acidobacteriaceae bacterium ZG23-2 TaxID=2883246 RepID=UPI00406C1BEC